MLNALSQNLSCVHRTNMSPLVADQTAVADE